MSGLLALLTVTLTSLTALSHRTENVKDAQGLTKNIHDLKQQFQARKDEVLGKAAPLTEKHFNIFGQNLRAIYEKNIELTDIYKSHDERSSLTAKIDALVVLDLADQHYAESLKCNPSQSRIWFERGEANVLLGKKEDALKYFKQAEKLYLNDRSSLSRAEHVLMCRSIEQLTPKEEKSQIRSWGF